MITVNVHNADRLEDLFKSTPKQAKIILWRALNRAATAGRTRASVSIRQNYIIKAGDVKKSIKLKSASLSRLNAELRASGPVTPLMLFRVSPGTPVKAAVKKFGMKPIDNAFVTRSRGGVNVFVREGASRYPIKALYGPSIAQMLGNEDVLENVIERTQEVLDERLEHELARLLRGEF